MFRRLALIVTCLWILPALAADTSTTNEEAGVRDLIGRWNSAYTHLDAHSLAALETDDFEIVDRFGHWVKTEGPEFNERLWSMTFRDIYHGKPGPVRVIESIRMLDSRVALVQARAQHADVTVLDDGTRIPPFWEIDTYTLVKSTNGWRVVLLNIHNQIDPQQEKAGEHVPDAHAPRRKL